MGEFGLDAIIGIMMLPMILQMFQGLNLGGGGQGQAQGQGYTTPGPGGTLVYRTPTGQAYVPAPGVQLYPPGGPYYQPGQRPQVAPRY